MTMPNTSESVSIEEAYKEVSTIVNDDYIIRGRIEFYIQGLKRLIKENPSSLGLNSDIFETKEKYLKQYLVSADPSLYSEQEFHLLNEKMDEFCKKDESGIFVLFWQAGTGKSIALQLKFIETVQEWEFEKKSPIPIFFNMADVVDLHKALNKINKLLGSNLSESDSLGSFYLFVDSFDEAAGIRTQSTDQRKGYAESYLSALCSKNSKSKLFFSCRTDLIYEEGNEVFTYFTTIERVLSEQWFIAPIGYKAKNMSSTWACIPSLMGELQSIQYHGMVVD